MKVSLHENFQIYGILKWVNLQILPLKQNKTKQNKKQKNKNKKNWQYTRY